MNILNAISASFITVGGIFALWRQFQMLQQNSYFLSRYFKWVKQNFKFRSIISLVLLVICTLSFIFNWEALGLIFSTLSIIRIKTAFSDNKKSIKKLVFTARVKRTMLVAVLILIATLICGILVNSLIYTLSCIFSFIPSVLVALSIIVTKPIEKSINRYYTNDAKKILKSIDGLKVIGITGSYGKTSTKYILGRMLSEKFNTVITPQSFNTPLGVVRTIREKIKPQTEIFVAEMGAKNVGDIKEICDIVKPTLGIITSVGPQHLDTFKSIENVVSTKFELANECSKNDGTVFLNTDNELIAKNDFGGKSITFGTKDSNDYKAENIKYGRNGLSFTLTHFDKSFKIASKLLGIHNALNIAAAAAVCCELGMNEKDITFAALKLVPVEHRLEMKNYISGSLLIDDAYNANPSGSLEAVRVLGSFEGMKKIIVTPGLVELGEKEYECNKNLGIEAAKHCDIIILVGKKRSVPIADGVKEQGFNESNLYIAESFKDAVGIFSPMCDKNTVILFENDLPDNYAG